MVTDQLLVFIKDQLRMGASKESIAGMLSGQGWTPLDIQQAFAAVGPSSAPMMPPPPPSGAPSVPPVMPSMPQPAPAPAATMPPMSSPAQPQAAYSPMSQATAGFSVDSLQKNQKFMKTVTTFAIYGAILYAVNAVASMLISAFHFSAYYNPFNISGLIGAVIAGAIGSAIGGAVFYFVYDPLHGWVKRTPFLSKHIHDVFTLLWKPFLVGFIVSAAFGLLSMLGVGAVIVSATAGLGAASFGGLFIGWAVGLVVQAGVYYWYAKTVSAKLNPYYQW